MAEQTIPLNENADAAMPEDTVALQECVIKLEEQNGELLRHLAEFQNRNNEMLQVMKRKDAELDSRLKYAHEKLSLDLLNALDNLDRALDAAKKVGDSSPLTVGVTVTYSQILDVLKRYGVSPLEAMNVPFDPMKHQAIQSIPAAKGQAPGTVVAVVQQGYTIHDRILRPAAVIVSQ
jgi:molecular chaperone GrpE